MQFNISDQRLSQISSLKSTYPYKTFDIYNLKKFSLDSLMVEHWILKGLSSEIGVIIGLAWFMTSSLEISSSFLDPGAEDVVKLVSLKKKNNFQWNQIS